MGEIGEKLYRIMFNKEKGEIEIEFEPWELSSSTIGETYYEKVVDELKKLGFQEEVKGRIIILKANISKDFDKILNKVKDILEEYETTIMLKKTLC
ncbi:MAG: hypothetical protein DRO23_08685 [Thermoprotei archaeon]|nr:MAG: hypothetical protein DRO23_08685 [Thermoprotei archaeon]